MTDRMKVGYLYPNSIPPTSPVKRNVPGHSQMDGAKSFQHLLNDQLVRISQHAGERLQQRGIELKPEQMVKIQSAIEKAAAKGAKESLLLMDNMAMIVNVKNRTIVTALDQSAMKDNVFTQIDSAVIIS